MCNRPQTDKAHRIGALSVTRECSSPMAAISTSMTTI